MDNDVLTRLAALDLTTDPYQEAKQLIYQLQKIGAIEYTLHAGKTITRGRTNGVAPKRGPSFSLAADLSFKPQEYNTDYQRASTPRQTMFYGSVLSPQAEQNMQERLISVSESSILLRHAHNQDDSPELQEEGMTFGSWVVTQDIPLLAVCYHKALSQNSQIGKELYEAFERDTAKLASPLREQSRAVNAFFAEEFAKPSHNFQGSHEYLLSAVFAEIAVERGMAGVYYPSVKAEGHGFNVAISPEFAAKALQLDKVLESTLYKRDGRFLLGADKFCSVNPGADTFGLQPLGAPDFVSRGDAEKFFNAQK